MVMRTKRRIFFFTAVAAVLLLGASVARATPSARPSLVLVTIDTLRADRLGCYGYHRDTTPTLDALAEEAVLFENAYTTMATTLPAHASIMTGTYPLTHGVVANAAYLPRTLADAVSLRTVAEMLSDEGYVTAAFVSAAPLKRHSGIDRGFEIFSQPVGLQRSSTRTTNQALDWVDQASPDEPFFLWVHYFDPHWPYSPPWRFRNQLGETGRLVSYLKRIGVGKSPSTKLINANDAYDGEVLYTDTEVGRLFDRLKKRGLWDRSVVVATADHGEGLGQHDYMYHGRIYNEQLRVPLLIKLPGQSSGRRTSQITSLIDLLPILSSVAALPISESDRGQFQGYDTLGSSFERDAVFSERTHRKGTWGPARRYALTSLRWKLLHSPTEGDALYDLSVDPYEMRNVIDEHPEVAEEMLASLSERIRLHYREPDPDSANATDAETLKQLRALGYIE